MGASESPTENFDLLVIGAGPTGMACAIEAQRAGFRSVLVDKAASATPSSTIPPT
jgi:thioredoxin reductase (NADPH)